MNLNEHLTNETINLFLSKEDFDRKGIELVLDGIAHRKCSTCSSDLIIFDALFDYFLENLNNRKLDFRVIDYYQHAHNGLRAIHCFYNPEAKKYRKEE